MDKEYMLNTIRARLKQCETLYRSYFSTDTGPSKSASGAACMRSRYKRDIELLKLLEYLVMYCPDNMLIESADIIAAFDRITEPRRLK